MSMPGAGGGGAQVVQQQSDPWGPSKPYLEDLMARAQGHLNTLQGYMDPKTGQWVPPRWGGLPSTVNPMSSSTDAGLRALESMGRNPDPTTGAAQQGLLSMIGGGDIAAAGATPTTAGVTTLTKGAHGELDPSTAGITSAARARTTAGTGALEELAAGGTNPYLDRAFEAASRPVMDKVRSAFFGQGGGSAYQQDLAQRGLGDLAAQIYMPAYESDANRRLSAGGALAEIEQGDLNRRLSGEMGAAGVGGANADRRLGAAGNLAGISQADRAARMAGLGEDAASRRSAMGLLPMLNQLQRQPAMDLLTAGERREAQSQQGIDDALLRYQEPMRLLREYSGLITGVGGLGDTSIGRTGTRQDAGLLDFLQLL